MTSKERHLLRTYGLSLEQYNNLRKKQRYLCAICQRHESSFTKALAVEHCHKTLEIYGLVCNYCNRYRIGRSHDYQLAKRIAMYLKKGTGLFVPIKPKKKKRIRKSPRT